MTVAKWRMTVWKTPQMNMTGMNIDPTHSNDWR